MGADAPDPVVGGVAHGDLRPPPLGRGRYPDGRRQPHACSPHTKPWQAGKTVRDQLQWKKLAGNLISPTVAMLLECLTQFRNPLKFSEIFYRLLKETLLIVFEIHYQFNENRDNFRKYCGCGDIVVSMFDCEPCRSEFDFRWFWLGLTGSSATLLTVSVATNLMLQLRKACIKCIEQSSWIQKWNPSSFQTKPVVFVINTLSDGIRCHWVHI
ncbi:hypothetical protein NPIL_685791 [Nephila pilipes]|uniref:Uncharacterized protein n=1 Tax=Nephila pilipes TaxID=299642 RepID=A0A8X6MC55_NEPPI|nr:hypothetical protein NPIL_685791 [Nephila pilipes]